MQLTIPRLPRGSRTSAVVAIHLVLIAIAHVSAFLLRFDFAVPAVEWQRAGETLPVLVVVQLTALAGLGVYRGSWRHVGLHDLVALAVATTAGTLAFAATALALGYLPGLPRSVLLLDALLFVTLAGGVRLMVRCIHEGRFSHAPRRGRRTLLIGAGEAAERFLRQSTHGGQNDIHVVGLLDDEAGIRGLSIHGVPVLGTIDDVARVAARRQASLLVIAIPSATGAQIRRILALCESTGLEHKILPPLRELLEGRAKIGQLRDVQLEDLLGRAPVASDLSAVERDLAGRTVMVTGGAGSIGSELARQIARFGPSRLILLEQAESPLYYVHLELVKAHPTLDVVPAIGDITDRKRVEELFRRYEPEYVFHAAAYKHVPMMEANPAEAVSNNVLGTLQLAECAARHGARKFVLISTDKAVNPSSVMGTTKRLAELIVLGWPSLRDSDTDFRAVRFGNVLGSEGSVVPLFRRQLAAGGPLTVTHPEVRRYFMTIPEASELVLQAAALPEATGRICMLDMGQPVRIVDLAEQLVRLSGLTPYRDVGIVFTGLRPGEKLDEELVSVAEASMPTCVEKIRVVRTEGRQSHALQQGVERLFAALRADCPSLLLRELHALVPEFATRNAEFEVALSRAGEPAPLADRVAVPAVAPGATPFDISRRLVDLAGADYEPQPHVAQT